MTEALSLVFAGIFPAFCAAQVSSPAVSVIHEVVIVGGGISGLSAAHFLKGVDFVILERRTSPGGMAALESGPGGEKFTGGVFSVIEPYGVVQTLYRDLKVPPLRIRAPRTKIFKNGKFFRSWLTPKGIKQLYAPTLPGEGKGGGSAGISRFVGEARRISESHDLAVPRDNCKLSALEKYDRLNFKEYVRTNFGGDAAVLADQFSLQAFGAKAEHVSAAIGMMALSWELGPGFGWAQGPSAVVEALAQELSENIQTGARVYKISQTPSQAIVLFEKQGSVFEVRAGAVIMAVPAFVTLEIVKDLPVEKVKAIKCLEYSSVAMAAIFTQEPLLRDTAVLWTPGSLFTALKFPGSANLAGAFEKDRGSPDRMALAYIPLGTDGGRIYLSKVGDGQIKKSVYESLDLIFPGLPREKVKMDIMRFPHAMPLFPPGYMTKELPVMEKPFKRIFFSGVETEFPSFEGAVFSGFKAARRVKEFLGK